MSMNDPHSEQFEQVRKLLALKRYEQPPPRYFNTFSEQVIARIQTGDRGLGRWSWLDRLWAALDSKPVLAGSIGLAACALVIGAVVGTDHGSGFVTQQAEPVTMQQGPAIGLSQIVPSTAPVAGRSGLQIAPALNASGAAQGSLFEEIQRDQQQKRPFQSETVVFKFNN